MLDLLPSDPRTRRLAIIVWGIGAVVGTAAVLWLSSYLDQLTELTGTDRGAALQLFRSRVLPALLVVVLVAAVSGAVLLRQGLQIVRSADNTGLDRASGGQSGRPARALGAVLAATGFLLAAIPLALLALMLWLLRNA